jgi:hypothetical protein
MTVVEFEHWAHWAADYDYDWHDAPTRKRDIWDELPEPLRIKINKVGWAIYDKDKGINT